MNHVKFVALTLISVLLGCGDSEKERLKSDTVKSQSEIANLRSEVDELKKTDSYYYQKALELDKQGNSTEAITMLLAIPSRFPNSRLAGIARSKASEILAKISRKDFETAKSEYSHHQFAKAETSFKFVISNYPHTLYAREAEHLLQGMDALVTRERIEAEAREKRKAKEAEEQATKDAEASLKASAKLELQSWHWREESSYAIAEGTVKNISSEPLKNVTAVVSFEDKEGNHITSGDAIIEFNPILPGQTSPFHAMATWNPAMRKAHIQFKELMGGTIDTYRKK